MPVLLLCVLLMVSVAPEVTSAQVTFSRRVYSENTRTYQQIWMWNPADGSLKAITKSERSHLSPECSADGKYIFFQSGVEFPSDTALWRFDRKSAEERKVASAKPAPVKPPAVPECADPIWAQDKTRFACSHGQNVFLYEGKTKKLIGKPLFTERRTPPSVIGWSPNRKWLLVTTQGESDNSTSRQSDFFVLDISRMAWIAAGSGNNALWVPARNEIVYSTPRELEPMTASSKHQEWSAHLVVFDPATRRRTTITSGVTNNIQPAACPDSRVRRVRK
jgi:hypothetical protein